MTEKAVCANCIGLLAHKLPVSRSTKGFIAGAIGFVSAFLEDRPEKCDSCGMLAPRCFHYKAEEEDEWCVHCGVDQEHHVNAGHKFLARIKSNVQPTGLDLDPTCYCGHRMTQHVRERPDELVGDTNQPHCTAPGCPCECYKFRKSEGDQPHG